MPFLRSFGPPKRNIKKNTRTLGTVSLEDDGGGVKPLGGHKVDRNEQQCLDVPLEVSKGLGSVGYNPNIPHL